MNFGIIRVEKIKSSQRFEQRLKHDYRLVDVRNADENLKNKNKSLHNVSRSKEIWVENFGKDGRFSKRRKDAVLALDYMITASPDFFIDDENTQEYFSEAYGFLVEKHGKENIISANLHYDETTPHMHVMVIPEKDGRLNARHFTGGKKLMRGLQDEFHKEVSSKFGLKRGRKNHVAAKHETIKDFYRRIGDWESLEQEIENKKKILAELEMRIEIRENVYRKENSERSYKIR